MRSNAFREARVSLYILLIIFSCCIVFFLVASMFTSMGYKAYHSGNFGYEDKDNTSPTIIIDAGHGGEDPGASSENGLLEKDVNLDISLLLYSYLTDCGYNVVLTRTDDVLLYDNTQNSKKKQDLENRVKIAQNYDNCCFISIHMNKYPAEYCKGLQTFYSSNNTNSKNLAESIQDSSKLLQTYNKRKVKDGTNTIFVLENIKSPAVLIECGFLSNSEESVMFKKEEYKMQIAFSIYCGITRHLETNYEG